MKSMTRALRVLLLFTALSCLVPAAALAAGPPVVTTGRASDLSPTAATVAGTVNPNERVTTWYFQFGRTTNYGNRTTAQDAGSGNRRVNVSSTLTGLRPNTTYHYRIVATNSLGTDRGRDRTFRTPQEPTISTIATTPNPVRFGSAVIVSGFLIGPNAGGGKQVALEGNAFPFTAGFQQIGNTVVTAPNSGYQFTFVPVVNTQLRVVDRTDPEVVSPVVIENVAIATTLNPSRRGRRGRVRFSGRLAPANSASVVIIQRRVRGGWKHVTTALPRTRAGATTSTYSKRRRVRPGVFRAVARPGGGAHVEGRSRGKRVRRR
jgi:hypothetical protein